MNEIARKPTLAHFLYAQEVENKIIEFTNSFINSKLVDFKTLLEDENINWLFFNLLVLDFPKEEKGIYDKLDSSIFYKYKSRQLYFLYPSSLIGGKLDLGSSSELLENNYCLHKVGVLNKLVKDRILIPIRRPNFMRTRVRYTLCRAIYYNDKLISKNKIDLEYYKKRFSKKLAKIREEAISNYLESKNIEYGGYGYFSRYSLYNHGYNKERFIVNKCGQPISLRIDEYDKINKFNQIKVNKEKNLLEILFPHSYEDMLKVLVDIKTNQVTGFDLVFRNSRYR
jgi:hypothetical protein